MKMPAPVALPAKIRSPSCWTGLGRADPAGFAVGVVVGALTASSLRTVDGGGDGREGRPARAGRPTLVGQAVTLRRSS
ncbi:hypothetical protein GCM10009836_17770 [Pseudonocardia ailaonensis]|uniref:Uncharacterized protein n=1 Tax=Pseudonocardia ailaonensis TaxID=367279 RepID=A0ABN2MUR8_9PSEU